QQLHQAILRGDPVQPAVPPPVRPRRPDTGVTAAQLPANVPTFAGRRAELNRLDSLLAPGPTGAPPAVVISAVSGTAGVGKTTLAMHWSHRVCERFPDGQLYVNLRGFDPRGQMMAP